MWMYFCCWRLCKYVDVFLLLASLYVDVVLLLASLCGCLFVVGVFVSMWMSFCCWRPCMWMSFCCWRLCKYGDVVLLLASLCGCLFVAGVFANMWMSFSFGVFVSMWMFLSRINGARYKLDGHADAFNNVSVIYCAVGVCAPPHFWN